TAAACALGWCSLGGGGGRLRSVGRRGCRRSNGFALRRFVWARTGLCGFGRGALDPAHAPLVEVDLGGKRLGAQRERLHLRGGAGACLSGAGGKPPVRSRCTIS